MQCRVPCGAERNAQPKPCDSFTQYRVDGGAGFWRHFDENNQTQTRDVVYLVESVFHEMMLQARQDDTLCVSGQAAFWDLTSVTTV